MLACHLFSREVGVQLDTSHLTLMLGKNRLALRARHGTSILLAPCDIRGELGVLRLYACVRQTSILLHSVDRSSGSPQTLKICWRLNFCLLLAASCRVKSLFEPSTHDVLCAQEHLAAPLAAQFGHISVSARSTEGEVERESRLTLVTQTPGQPLLSGSIVGEYMACCTICELSVCSVRA